MPDDADPGVGAEFTRSQAWYDLSLGVDPNDANTLFIGGIDLFRSNDAGASWTQVSHWYGGFGFPEVHADQHAVVYKPGSSDEVVFSHDGGVTYTADALADQPTWVNRNEGYNVTQYYSGALGPLEGSNFMLAGAQDNGTQRYFQEGFGYTSEANGGDGGYTFIDQDQPNYAIASTVYNNFRLSTNGGISFSTTLLNEGSGSFINTADYDDRENILYTNRSGSNFWRVKDVTSTRVAQQIPYAIGGTATALRVSPYAPEGTSTLFVGTSSGRLFRATNAGADDPGEIELEELESPWPGQSVSCIEIGESEDQLLVTFSNYGRVSVWESLDGGTTWFDREGDLPDMPVRWALYHPTAAGVAIIATEAGVWETTNLGAEEPRWTPSPSFPTVSTYMLQWRASDNQVMAATHGRGVFTAFWDANVVSNEGDASDPDAVELTAAYPNPFVDRTQFSLRLDDAQNVRVEVYDLRGRRVAVLHDGLLSASEHRFEVEAAGLAAGTYLYVAAGETFQDEGRVTLVR